MPTVIPTCRLVISLNEGRVSRGEIVEVELLPPPRPPHSRIQVWWGILPQLPHRHASGTLGLPSLFLRSQLLVVGTVRFPLRYILRQVDALRRAVSMPKTLHKFMSTMRG
jgi:hypothetical protein